MKVKVTSLYVNDQEKALRFYTEALGFAKKNDFSQGPYRWLTVASPEEPDGTELQLALNNNPAAKAYQQAIFEQNQPAIMFFTDDVKGDYERIKAQRRRVHHAAYRRDCVDHRHAEGHLRQSHSDYATEKLVGRMFHRRHKDVLVVCRPSQYRLGRRLMANTLTPAIEDKNSDQSQSLQTGFRLRRKG